jgi:hypothetical protein
MTPAGASRSTCSTDRTGRNLDGAVRRVARQTDTGHAVTKFSSTRADATPHRWWFDEELRWRGAFITRRPPCIPGITVRPIALPAAGFEIDSLHGDHGDIPASRRSLRPAPRTRGGSAAVDDRLLVGGPSTERRPPFVPTSP